MELEGISKQDKEEGGGGGGGGEIEKVNLSSAAASEIEYVSYGGEEEGGGGGRGGEIEKVNLSSAAASEIEYVSYGGEEHLPLIMGLVDQELSEPYSIFTYRYFVYLWPQLCFMAFHGGRCVGTVVCKMGEHRNTYRGYIAMLVVIKPYRGKGIATQLVTGSIQVMKESGCKEVMLEAEVTNKGALALYGRLGFIRANRLFQYYLNGLNAFRLKLLFPRPFYSFPSQSQANNDNMAMPLPMED